MTSQADGHDPHHHDDSGHHDDHHHHGHGHENDQGLKGAIRYLRMAPQFWRSSINDAVVARLAPTTGETVVDIGAGMGAGSVVAAKLGATVHAIEPTPFMRNILAARRYIDRVTKTLTVHDGAAEKMPLAADAADAVFSVNTMHHWVDVDVAAVEIARVLKPGGQLLLVDEDFEDPTHPDHERFAAKHSDGHHGFSMVDAEAMGRRFSSAGMVDVQARAESLDDRPCIMVTAAGAG